jgi:hypothetical protein
MKSSALAKFVACGGAQLALWTAGIVVLTLLVNAPLMPYLLRWTNLSGASPVKARHLTCHILPSSEASTSAVLKS